MVRRGLSRKSSRALVENSYEVQRCAVLLALLLVCSVSAFGGGCVPIEYKPKEDIIDQLSFEQAKRRLDETLSRSKNPQISSIDLTDDFLLYRYRSGRYTAEKRFFFLGVDRVEVFNNHVVLVRASNGDVLAVMAFSNDEDAKTFADFVTSFRARRVSIGGSR